MRDALLVKGQKPLSWREIALVSLLATLAVFAMYWYLWFDLSQMRWMATTDSLLDMIPTRFYYDYCIHHGHFPWWNPLSFCGEPFAANPARSIGYPPNLLRALLTSSPTPLKTAASVALMVFCHMVLGAVGMYAYGRSQGLGRAGAGVAALVYIFNAQYVYHFMVGHWSWPCMLAWFPLLMLVLDHCLDVEQMRAKMYFSVLGGFLFGLMMLVGVPQVFCTAAFLMVLYVAVHRLLGGRPHTNSASAPWTRTLATDVLVLAVLFGLGATISAGMLIPALQYAQLSMRGGAGDLTLFRRAGTSPLVSLSQVFVYATPSGALRFAGAAAWILAVGAFCHRRRRTLWVHVLLFIVALDCCMGVPFPFATLLALCAPFKASTPTRTLVFANFFLGVLAGLGTDSIAAAHFSRFKRLVLSGALLCCTALALAALVPQITVHPYLGAVSPAVLLFPAAVLLWSFSSTWLKQQPRWFPLVAPVLLFGGIWVWNAHYIPWKSENAYTTASRWNWDYMSEQKSFWADNYRGSSDAANSNLYDLEPAINGYSPLFIKRVRNVICAPGNEKNYGRGVGGAVEVCHLNRRGLLFLKRQFWLVKTYAEGCLPGKCRLWPPTTVAFLPAPPADLPIAKVSRAKVLGRPHSNNAMTIPISNTDGTPFHMEQPPERPRTSRVALPEVSLPQRHTTMYVEIGKGPRETEVYMDLQDPNSASREMGWVYPVGPENTPAVPAFVLPDYPTVKPALVFKPRCRHGDFPVSSVRLVEDLADENAHIEILDREPNSVSVRLHDLPEARLLLNVDAAYPGWKATLNGDPVPILRANDVFKAVFVPAGTHTVTFSFTLPWARFGWTVSALSGTAVSLWLAVYALRSKIRGRSA